MNEMTYSIPNFIVAVIILSLNMHVLSSIVPNLGDPFRERVELGKGQLTKLRNQITFGHCWVEAVRAIEDGCQSSSSPSTNANPAYDDTRSRLAVQLTNCHLSKSGMAPYRCANDMTIEECTRNMMTSPIAFNTYTQYTLHVDNICFYIQSQLFQEDSERTIQMIQIYSKVAEQTLQSVHVSAQNMESNMQVAAEQQARILEQQLPELKHQLSQMNEAERLRFEELTETFVSLQSMSNRLLSHMSTLSKDHSDIIDKQRQMGDISKEQFDILKTMNDDLARSANEGLRSSRQVLQQQESMKESITVSLESLSRGHLDLSNQQRKLSRQSSGIMDQLTESSRSVSEQLQLSSAQQKKLLEQQHATQEFFETFHKEQRKAFDNARHSLDGLLQASEETSAKIQKYHGVFMENFARVFEAIDRVRRLVRNILGEFVGIKTFIYYGLSAMVVIMLTKPREIYGARIWMLLTLVANAFLERAIWSLETQGHFALWAISALRSAAWICCVVIIVLFWMRYRDWEKENNALLQCLKQKNDNDRTQIHASLECLAEKVNQLMEVRYVVENPKGSERSGPEGEAREEEMDDVKNATRFKSHPERKCTYILPMSRSIKLK